MRDRTPVWKPLHYRILELHLLTLGDVNCGNDIRDETPNESLKDRILEVMWTTPDQCYKTALNIT